MQGATAAWERAEEELRAAAALEDAMTYMEPPYVHAPVRHCLGKVLLDAGGFVGLSGARTRGTKRQLPHLPASRPFGSMRWFNVFDPQRSWSCVDSPLR